MSAAYTSCGWHDSGTGTCHCYWFVKALVSCSFYWCHACGSFSLLLLVSLVLFTCLLSQFYGLQPDKQLCFHVHFLLLFLYIKHWLYDQPFPHFYLLTIYSFEKLIHCWLGMRPLLLELQSTVHDAWAQSGQSTAAISGIDSGCVSLLFLGLFLGIL